jgi:aspartate/methionine/tyrosine aminotransferase
MQLWGLPRSLGARVNTFSLRLDRGWEPDWDEFDRAVSANTKLVYVSNPNNPTGSVLSEASMARIVRRCEEMGAYLVADEVYQGAEIERERTRSFWGMSDRVIVTSGLSKAYGIPGVRIGCIVGPADVVYECWSQHDYLTIGPNKLSDLIARTAVENRDRLYARTRRVIGENLAVFTRWLDGFNGFLAFRPPEAGAIAFVKYTADLSSVEIADRVRRNRSTLIVPGRQLGMEGYLRIWIGGKPEFMAEGLRRIGAELQEIARGR